MRIIVTGGYGFIGSALIRYILSSTNYEVLNIDSLTYAACKDSLKEYEKVSRYSFKRIDITNIDLLEKEILSFKPNIIFHLAAETHVDRSIKNPFNFINTNIFGTYNLLQISRKLNELNKDFLFHHVSTDEVFGDLDKKDGLFNEDTPYNPSSPYSASKASSDHLVRSWSRTFGINYIITNCSNNYGCFQHPEKLIPTTVLKAINGEHIPIYGNGTQIRDWLYVEDHAEALCKVAFSDFRNTTFNIGGNNMTKNIDVVNTICSYLDILVTKKPNNVSKFSDLITYVEDRPGHDRVYAIDISKIRKELNWEPNNNLESGLKKTVKWYVDNLKWSKQFF